MNARHEVRAVASHFQIYGDFLSAEPYGSGHINDTYCVVFNQAGTRVRYIFQRINHRVFQNPVALMENKAQCEWRSQSAGLDSRVHPGRPTGSS